MKIAVQQPNFMPWAGYFSSIISVDIFVFFDNAKFGSKPKRMSRNLINNIDGRKKYLSLDISGTLINKNICDCIILKNCIEKHLLLIKDFYKKAPYFIEVYEILVEAYQFKNFNLSLFNINLIKLICDLLKIKKNFLICSKDFPNKLISSQDYIINIVKNLGGSEYFTPKNGVKNGIYDIKQFLSQNISFKVQDFGHLNYERPNFQSNMSIIDLLFYDLPNAMKKIVRNTSWKSHYIN